MSDDLFPETRPAWAETPKPEKVSADRARTARAAARIARGVHPLNGRPLKPGESCGSCIHLRVKAYSSTYFKCGLWSDSKGPATDIRKRWPACELWEAK